MIRLYSGTTCPFSQRCRIVLFEKGMDFEIIDIDLYDKPPEIFELNPYGRVPILLERELVIYESNIINEYIDERFPHPQLMPSDPIMRSRARLLLFHFDTELFCYIPALERGGDESAEVAPIVADRLNEMMQIFSTHKYMLGEEFSMLDVAIAPLLWRIPYYGIDLGSDSTHLLRYSDRIFNRQGFIDSLTPQERVMRK